MATQARASAPPATSASNRRSGPGFAPFRHPEETLLYQVVEQHLGNFLARAERAGSLPRFVRRELEGFLVCGLPERGFIRVRCSACRLDGLVAFSCKGRGFCPSCGGRRMADTAAHLVDRVLPEVPVRQWVLTFPYPLRFVLANDRRLCSRVLSTFQRALLGWYRRRGREWLGFEDGESGTVTAIQRFNSSLGLSPHLHVLALDGVYTATTEPDAPPVRFHALPEPETDEVAALLRVVVRRTLRALVRARRLRVTQDGYEVVPLEEVAGGEEPSALTALEAASVSGRVALGARAGRRVIRLGDRVEAVDGEAGRGRDLGPRCAEESGFNLHADVWVDAQDRARLERLCRYILRPPLATARLEAREDGRIEFGLRRPWRDGTTGFVFEPVELIARLAALVPAPRGHMIRYHGVLGPRSRWRSQVVRDRASHTDAPVPGDRAPAACPAETPGPQRPAPTVELRERRLTWAELMQRVYAVDVLECPRCRGRRRLIAVLTDPAVIEAFLASVGLPARAPPRGPVREEDPEEAEPGEADLPLG